MSNVAEPSLVDKVLQLHSRFDAAKVGHAFGGALALAFYTPDPRATADIDVNVELPADRAMEAFDALPAEVLWTVEQLAHVRKEEQIRVWWGRTPIDLFFRASSFHDDVAKRSVRHRFARRQLPFLAANDLAVFKALFDRPKDWVDIETMATAETIDLQVVIATCISLVGEDVRTTRLRSLIRP